MFGFQLTPLPLSPDYVQWDTMGDTELSFQIEPGDGEQAVVLMAVGISPRKMAITKTGGVLKTYIS